MWGRFTKSGLQLESVLPEPLRTDVCKTWVSAVAFLVSSHSRTTDSVRSVSPGLKTKRTGLLLSGPKLCSVMKVNLDFPLEIRVPESGGREERHRIHVAYLLTYFIVYFYRDNAQLKVIAPELADS